MPKRYTYCGHCTYGAHCTSKRGIEQALGRGGCTQSGKNLGIFHDGAEYKLLVNNFSEIKKTEEFKLSYLSKNI
jgi:hypothetical protein